MRNFQKILIVVAAIAGIVLVGILLGWWGSRGRQLNPQLVTEPVAPPPSAERSRPPAVNDHVQTPGAKPVPPKPIVKGSNLVLSVTGTNLITDWEDKVDQILTSDGEDSAKTKTMIEMFPHLPEDGQVEVAQHLSNLLPDENYEPLGKFLKDSRLPEPVLDV